ncbi:MAG: hypothetical protein EAZ65_02170 [Verrucomicrobia bacterium]|nr:MAG: hypothetical protein EAZ82_02560 [Verrucomicrobiota bacterium]TAF27351.1 MAG: hypothetical protein EAZ71_02520 [Verrucomicrobiota bacterium]TAF42358.1 MAG: hypothetical protein EAZ65_02170 [Verrucomicrobiota bacterium]
MRNELPLDDETQRWGLATALLHRGDVLHRSEGREQDARDAFDAAISQLRELPYQSNPSYLQRLALATSNRGLVAQDPAEARRCFDDAIALIPEPQNPPQLLTLCSALLNRGRHSLQIAGDSDASSSDARQVLTLLSPHEKQHPSPAELALQGRLLLSHALCTWLDDSRQGPGEKDDWVGDATDAVEDALALERHWEQLGYQGLRPVARELFQLGLHVYRVRQPHFFAEFLVESMDPEMSPGAPFDDPGFQSATGHALRQAVEETARRASAASLDPQIAAKQHAILESLRAADHRLASLQQARAAAKG